MRYTDSDIRYTDSSSRSTAQIRATTTHQNPRFFLVSLSELSVSVVFSLEFEICPRLLHHQFPDAHNALSGIDFIEIHPIG